MEKKLRANKKQEYINGIEFDINSCKEAIARIETTGRYFAWWHGEQYTRSRFERFIKEFEVELAAINADKNYKPWKDKDLY